jgi:hypothetical protein
MLAVQNTISIKLGDSLQGSAEGPLGIGALLVIAMLVAVIFCQRNPPPWRMAPSPLIVLMKQIGVNQVIVDGLPTYISSTAGGVQSVR